MALFRPNAVADANQQRAIRDTIARSLQILEGSSSSDTFLGRKTQEPFPKEDLDARMAKWVVLKGLRPPN